MGKASRQAFEKLVDSWKEKSRAAAEVAERYRSASAKILVASVAKSAEQRKAEADSLTSDLRLARDNAAIEAEAAAWLLRYEVIPEVSVTNLDYPSSNIRYSGS